LEKQGLIQAFEYVFELAWNLIRDYLLYQGHTDIKGSRDAIKTAFKYGLIEEGEYPLAWTNIPFMDIYPYLGFRN